jgi:hypothetical protein
MDYGKKNIAVGLIVMALFMVYGFILIYLRDFASGKEQWIAEYGFGKHFESRLAHVHGNLFAFLNIVIGYLLISLPYPSKTSNIISWLTLIGLLMPIGILMEVYLSASPIFVLIGGFSIFIAVFWMGISSFSLNISSKKEGN